MATVKLFGSLRSYVATSTMVVDGVTVHQLLQNLCDGNDPLHEAIFDGDQVRPFIRIKVNGRDSELAQGLDTPIKNRDQIAIFPPIAGG